MKVLFVKFACLVALTMGLTTAAKAAPVLWTLNNVTFDDGGTATGSFIFDADAGTACSTSSSPCGMFYDVNIMTTGGSALSGATYSVVCGTNNPSCTGVVPDSTEAMFLTSTAADQTGNTAIAFFFTPAGPVPPAGLTDAGGVVDISDSMGTGAVQEAVCGDPGCADPTSPSRASLTGTLSGVVVPEPAELGLVGLGLLALMLFRRRVAA